MIDPAKWLRVSSISARAGEVFGNRDKALEWLQTPSPALNGATPLDAIETESGCQEVEDILGLRSLKCWSALPARCRIVYHRVHSGRSAVLHVPSVCVRKQSRTESGAPGLLTSPVSRAAARPLGGQVSDVSRN
jgi:hypothetical protein